LPHDVPDPRAAAFSGVVIFMMILGLIALYRFWFSPDRREKSERNADVRARVA
jgi:hypothetical protein